VKALVILPTYNEKETLPVVIEKIMHQGPFDVLVIDDNSPDGTAEAAMQMVRSNLRVNLMERPAKLGLGTAYVAGFKWGLQRDYDCFIEMDADMSHNPLDLPRFLREIENGNDLVIGSRYVRGKISVVGWEFRRLLMSKFGNYYATRILRVPLTDVTSGFRAFSRRALRSVDLEGIHSEGYSFQIEMAYLVMRAGLKVREIPIIFTERQRGDSKMSRKIIREAVWLPWKLRAQHLGNYISPSSNFKRVALEATETGEADDRKKPKP
jgi:dolichol-phosphate mannosyltransferase